MSIVDGSSFAEDHDEADDGQNAKPEVCLHCQPPEDRDR